MELASLVIKSSGIQNDVQPSLDAIQPSIDATLKPVGSYGGSKSCLEYLELVTKTFGGPRYALYLKDLRQPSISSLFARLYASLRATRAINVLSSSLTRTELGKDIFSLKALLSSSDAAAPC